MAIAVTTGPEQLLLELFAIFVSAKVIGELFERFTLPSVLGEGEAGLVSSPRPLRPPLPVPNFFRHSSLPCVLMQRR